MVESKLLGKLEKVALMDTDSDHHRGKNMFGDNVELKQAGYSYLVLVLERYYYYIFRSN